jgi:hypothetical protein
VMRFGTDDAVRRASTVPKDIGGGEGGFGAHRGIPAASRKLVWCLT